MLCSPLASALLGVLAVSMGVGLLVQPELMAMTDTLAYRELGQILPQQAWAALLITSGTLQVGTIWASTWLHFGACSFSFGVWTVMAFVTMGLPYTLAPWLFWPIAAKNFAVLVMLAWKHGHVS